MNTIPDNQAGSRRRRRIHSDEFKARAVAICMQPGMSMAAVAMAHGVNANLLRRWVPEPEMKPPAGEGSNIAARETQAPDRKTLFLPVGLPAPSAPAPCADIRTSCSAAQRHNGCRDQAGQRRQRVRCPDARVAPMICIDVMWQAVEPIDMRAGAERLLARVVQVFGIAQTHANARSTRIKLPVHDGFGVWRAARRLNAGRFNAGRFTWAATALDTSAALALTGTQSALSNSFSAERWWRSA